MTQTKIHLWSSCVYEILITDGFYWQKYIAFSLTFLHYCFIQALEWIHDNGEFYLSTHTSTGSSIQHTQELLKEHEEFQITAKVK